MTGGFLIASTAAAAGEHVSHALFEIPGIGLAVTSEVTTMWAIMLLLFIGGWLVTRNLKREPAGLQNAMEMVIDAFINTMYGPVMGKKKARQYLPLLGTFFLFIIVSNYSGLLPGAGSLPGFKPPTSTLSVTIGLAAIVFFATHIAGVKENGLRYFKHFTEPYIFFLPINVLEEFVKPLSLSLRLFGNIFGEEMLLAVLLTQIAPYLIPVPIMGLDLIFGFIQAFIFSMLASVYIASATKGHH